MTTEYPGDETYPAANGHVMVAPRRWNGSEWKIEQWAARHAESCPCLRHSDD